MTEQELKKRFDALVSLPGENEWVEFKEAKKSYDFKKLGKYFSALSNEANLKGKEYGWLIFGVEDKKRKVVGTQFRPNRADLDHLKLEIAEKTSTRLTFKEIYDLILPEGRVILFQIPAALSGIPTAWEGHFYGRDGESIVALSLWEIEQIRKPVKRILDNQVEIMDLTKVCRSFPESPNRVIKRENLLDTIDIIFEGDTQLTVVEAEEGMGKTTLLAQYAKRHPDYALSLFIKPTSSVAYSPDYLREILSEQLHWALHKEPLNREFIDDSFFKTQLIKLEKKALRNREIFYFIVDGLDDIPKEDSRVHDIVLKDILPLGLKGFRFLLAGDLKQFTDKIHKSVSCKSFPLSTFTPGEAERYLSDLKNLDEQTRKDICKMCKRVPAHLASVRRMQQTGYDIKKIFNEDPENLPDFIAMEWRKIAITDDKHNRLLAILAYGRGEYTIDDLARIVEVERVTVEEFFQSSGIITINPQKQVSYLSEPHRKYAAEQLRNFKEEVTNLLIDDLQKNSDTEVALRDIPNYFEQTGRFSELIDFLTPEYFEKVLKQSQSLNPVLDKADLGLRASQKLNQKEALMRFSMQKSVITQLDKAEIWRSEIEARMALEDYGSALALAQFALKEDRLHLLAVITKMQRKKGLVIEQELMNQIRLLYDEINHKALGEKAVEIASDLIWTDPDLAINLIEAATSTDEDSNALDWAFATFSIAALDANREQAQYSDTLEKTRSKIKDPKAQRFF